MSTKTLQISNPAAGQKASTALTATIQSTLLFFCTMFPAMFLTLLFHEGGHALADLLQGGKIDIFYVHPFALDGYVRPIQFWENVWGHAAGPALGTLGAGLLFILFWKRRSLKTLPLVFVFPWCATLAAFNMLNLANHSGDYANIIKITGIAPAYFYVLNGVLALSGIFFFVSLLPLFGLNPGGYRSLIVLPAGLLLWGLVGVTVAYLTVPVSPIAVRYDLGESLLSSAKMYPVFAPVVGLLLAGIYVTLYRWFYRKLPAGLRCETTRLAWQDFRLPVVWAALSSVLGLILITLG